MANKMKAAKFLNEISYHIEEIEKEAEKFGFSLRSITIDECQILLSWARVEDDKHE